MMAKKIAQNFPSVTFGEFPAAAEAGNYSWFLHDKHRNGDPEHCGDHNTGDDQRKDGDGSRQPEQNRNADYRKK